MTLSDWAVKPTCNDCKFIAEGTSAFGWCKIQMRQKARCASPCRKYQPKPVPEKPKGAL